jgi:6,7-dimethyl-8-ribityllumazine synthase
MNGPRILVIEARFYDDIADQLLSGVSGVLTGAKATLDRITVPGIFEVPAALSMASQAKTYDGYITLGCAIKGETDHYEHISHEAMRGITDLVLARTLALGNGILTVRTYEQAIERARSDRRNFGGQAARACLRMIALKQELVGG